MIKWHGAEFLKYFRDKESERLEAGAIYLENKIKENISEPSPPPAAAGEPFHKETGAARASISHEVDKDKLVARVGSNSEVVKFQELGTDKMPPHPVLEPTLNDERKQLGKILTGKQ